MILLRPIGLRSGLGAAALVASVLAGFTHSEDVARPAGGSIHEVVIPAPAVADRWRHVLVYLPSSYDRPEAMHRRYPVILLLHGGPGRNRDWIDKAHVDGILDDLISHRAMPEVIAIMPDATGPGRLKRSLYVNSYDGAFKTEDFIVHDVVTWADRELRTRADVTHRALVGISDGGGAALNLAFHHPDVFGACAGHSGDYRLRRERGMEKILGPEPESNRILAENSPVLYVSRLAPRLKHMRIYFDCGLFDLAFLDDRELDAELTQLHVPHMYQEFLGIHSWGFWRARLRQSLPWITAGMR